MDTLCKWSYPLQERIILLNALVISSYAQSVHRVGEGTDAGAKIKNRLAMYLHFFPCHRPLFWQLDVMQACEPCHD